MMRARRWKKYMGPGLTIILAGHADITQHDQSGRRTPIVTYGAPAGAVTGAADCGSRTRRAHLRALILRRVGLIET